MGHCDIAGIILYKAQSASNIDKQDDQVETMPTVLPGVTAQRFMIAPNDKTSRGELSGVIQANDRYFKRDRLVAL